MGAATVVVCVGRRRCVDTHRVVVAPLAVEELGRDEAHEGVVQRAGRGRWVEVPQHLLPAPAECAGWAGCAGWA
eukprot:scaffold74707_cov48-Phaeocystis_antarctica.AAC.1